jgi:uncharacterized protein with HEPN domain
MHMLNYAEKTAAIAKSSREDLETDTMPEFALLHGVQTIGEAAVNVSEATRNRFPSIPWSRIIGMRNRLVHGYDSVDHGILWQTVCESVPELAEELLRHIPPEQT